MKLLSTTMLGGDQKGQTKPDENYSPLGLRSVVAVIPTSHHREHANLRSLLLDTR